MLLMKFPAFNRHFVIVNLGKAYKIFRSIPTEKLKRTPITTTNILSFKFDIYDAFHLLKEYAAQIDRLDMINKCISINVWDSRQMNTLIKTVTLSLTEQTFFELKELYDKKVFNERLGNNYMHFISIYLHSDIKRKANGNRGVAEGTLLYSLRSENDNKERRLKSKFSLTKQEAIAICSYVSYWQTD